MAGHEIIRDPTMSFTHTTRQFDDMAGAVTRSIVVSVSFPCHFICGISFTRSVYGDVVWVKAQAEEQVLAILDADRELTGQEHKANDLINSGW